MLYVRAGDTDLLRQVAIHLIAETPEPKMFEVLLALINGDVIDPHNWMTRLMRFIWGAQKVNEATLTIASKREGIKKLWTGVMGILSMGVWEQERLDKFIKILYHNGWEPNDSLIQFSKDRQNGY